MANARSTERQIGDILVEQGIFSPLQLDEALQRQRLTGDMLGRVLVSMGYCEEQHIIEALGVQSGMERVDLTRIKIPEDVVRKMPGDVAKFYSVIPIRATDHFVTVAMADPFRRSTIWPRYWVVKCAAR
jgi:type IV pilus assembly protein PilB